MSSVYSIERKKSLVSMNQVSTVISYHENFVHEQADLSVLSSKQK